MNIFILEDDINRMDIFMNKVFPRLFGEKLPHISYAANVEKAYLILSNYKHFDLMLLDHDLGGQQYVDSKNENTGYQVAKFIKANGVFYEQCIIHSMNPAGAQRMKHILTDARVIPFTELLAHI